MIKLYPGTLPLPIPWTRKRLKRVKEVTAYRKTKKLRKFPVLIAEKRCPDTASRFTFASSTSAKDINVLIVIRHIPQT